MVTVGAAVLRNRWSSPLERQHSWALHTHRQRQSCSQHSSGRLSDVCCVCVCGGGGVGWGGENVSHASMLHWEDG